MRLNIWPLQSNCDAVKEDKEQDHMVKHPIRDEPVAGHPKPIRHKQKLEIETENIWFTKYMHCILVKLRLLTHFAGRRDTATSLHALYTIVVYKYPASSSDGNRHSAAYEPDQKLKNYTNITVCI